MAPDAPNPNWPNLFSEGNFGNNPFYAPSASLMYTDLSPRLFRDWTVRRGKQFELDQVQPGEFHGEWINSDGALDPTNGTSPYATGLLPFRGYRMRAAYPSSVNLVTADQATGGEGTPVVPGPIPAAMNIGTDIVGSTLTIASSGTAFQGSQVLQSAVPASASVNFYIIKILLQPVLSPTASIAPTYTWSTYVRCATSSINPSVAAAVKYHDINGNYVNDYTGSTVVLTGNPAAAWTRISVTHAVPTGAAYCELAVAVKGTPPASPWTFQMDGSQFEQSTAVSSFTVPGKNYAVYSGLIERYPQSWDYGGTYGTAAPVSVDVMALLSQTTLKEAFIMDVLATGPAWFFPLNDAAVTSGTQTFQEESGSTPPAGVYSASAGPGTLTAGANVTAATLPGGKFYGTNGPVVQIDNSTPFQGTVIDMTAAGITSAPTTGAWTRMIAFRSSVVPSGSQGAVFAAYSTGLNPLNYGFVSLMNFGLQPIGGGPASGVSAYFTDATGTHSLTVSSSVSTNDNNWHLAFVQMSADGKTVTVFSGGVATSVTGSFDLHPTLAVNESVGGEMFKLDGTVSSSPGNPAFVGDLALYAQWNSLLTNTQMLNLRSSFMTAYRGESTDARYRRILGWAGYQGASSLDVGNTTSLTYANDLADVDALSALNDVVSTEVGRHFVAADGTVTFQNRSRFFQASTPVWVFGENQAAGEIPYVDISFDFDPTRISNAVEVTSTDTKLLYSANDATSQQSYGKRNFTRNNQSTDQEEVRESAYFYLSLYKDPHMRVQTLRVDAAVNPALWPLVLAFELGQYVQINRRDQFGVRPTIAMYGFIEQISHAGNDSGKWQVDLQISPAAASPYATFTALVTTLASPATAGNTTITINALPDAATNPVRSELTGGQFLHVAGGSGSEYVVIDTGGVQDQAAGYSTAVLTLTGPLLNSYPSGAEVREGLTSYDSLAVFDTVQFSF
jgi:hypothetical protein